MHPPDAVIVKYFLSLISRKSSEFVSVKQSAAKPLIKQFNCSSAGKFYQNESLKHSIRNKLSSSSSSSRFCLDGRVFFPVNRGRPYDHSSATSSPLISVGHYSSSFKPDVALCSMPVFPLQHRSCSVCMSYVRLGHHNG